MNLWQLVGKEIRFRMTGFVLGLVSVAAAIACLVGAVTLVQAHDLRTEQILAERESGTRAEMERLEDDYRRIMRDLGYNVMVLHEDQSLAALRATGHPDTEMPLEYAEKLGRGYIETLNHLLPILQKRVVWPEHDTEVILSGTPGQVPVSHKPGFLTEDGTAYKNPIMQAIPPGAVRLGHGIAQELGVKEGDEAVFMGTPLRVERIHAPEGNQDDIAVWCALDQVQEWLGMEGKINAILALECVCDHGALGAITAEVNGVLPDTQVLEFSSRVIARAEARARAAEAHETAIQAEIAHRAQMAAARRTFAAVLVPVVLTGSAIWVFFLVLGNVRERKSEIGILRALGVRESSIVSIFLLKAIVMGLAGAIGGYLVGTGVGAMWGGIPVTSPEFMTLVRFPLFVAALLVAPALCAIAGWLPAMRAAHQDPAVVLREE